MKPISGNRILWCAALAVAALCLLWTPGVYSGGSQQASGITGTTVINNARNLYLNEQNADFWTDAYLLTTLNNGIMEVVSLTKCLETNEVFKLQTGTTEYAISTAYLSIEKVLYSGATAEGSPSQYKGIRRAEIQQFGNGPGEGAGEPTQYYVWNDRIGVIPEPSSSVSGYKLHAYMVERPTAISAVSAVPTPAQYDPLLELYIAAKALYKRGELKQAKTIEADYYALLKQLRGDYVERPKEPEGVLK